MTGATTATGIQYHEQDELGNVLGTHTGTSVTESISYDPWGVPSYTGTLNSRLMWKGLMWEGGPAQGDVVGLSYVRGRWYDPQPGRFIQEDPLGVDGGVNVYLYAGDDPINGFDPSGTNECWYHITLTHYVNGKVVGTEDYDTAPYHCGGDGPVQIGEGGSGGDPGARSLTAQERKDLGNMCSIIDCDKVVVHVPSDNMIDEIDLRLWIAYSGGAPAITPNNNIYINTLPTDGNIDLFTLAHEMTHVYQYQQAWAHGSTAGSHLELKQLDYSDTILTV